MRFCTFGPGSPSMLTTSGAAIATTISSTMNAERDERHAILAQPAPEQLPGRARGDLTADLEEVQAPPPGAATASAAPWLIVANSARM